MYDKTVFRCFFPFIYLPDGYKTQEMCDSVVSEDSFMIVYCSDKYKTQRMCDEAVDKCLAALKFIPAWFLTSKTLQKHDNALLANNDIVFFQ